MERAIGRGIGGVSFANERFTDLDFADDAVIFAETKSGLAAFLGALGQEAESLGLLEYWDCRYYYLRLLLKVTFPPRTTPQ